jgi:tRNA threonylcarbamoyladenosine biosynthesis protein TsaB
MAIMIGLVLEAATYAGSVALLNGDRVLGERSVAMRGREREALMPAVAELLIECGVTTSRVERIICGAGPGSFTSLRIAGGIAKGLAMSAGIPLVPVSSLALLVASRDGLAAGRYLGAIDALRGEHYVAAFDVGTDGMIRQVEGPRLVTSSHLATYATEQGATLIAAGESAAGVVAPHARAAAWLIQMIDATDAADLAAWEPAYGRLAEAQVKWEAAHGRPLIGA